MKTTIQFLLIFVCYMSVGTLQGQNAPPKYTISGYVEDAASGERLIACTVMDRKSGAGTVTNTFGFFSLTLPSDSVHLLVTYIGFKSFEDRFFLNKNISLKVPLSEKRELKEVTITAERIEKIEEQVQMSRMDVPIEQIKKVPALLGERDVLKALQLLPGVSGGGEGQSGLYVRGGGPDQNLILLDGVPVYNASHLFGFFSVFNSDAIKDVSLTKGGFPARYGGRLSSVVEITMKEGNENEFHGEGAIGIVASRLTLEGPIKKGVSSFIISGRRTYIDILMKPLIQKSLKEEGSEGDLGYFFHDINAKVNYKISPKDRLYLSLYTGKDKFYADITENFDDSKNSFENGLGWGNVTSALRWNRELTPKLFANTTLTYSRYNFNTKTAAGTEERFGSDIQKTDFFLQYFSGIDDIAAKLDFDYLPSPKHLVKFGTNVIYHTFKPGKFDSRILDTEQMIDNSFSLGQPNLFATELATYVEDDWRINGRVRINAGLHLSNFFAKEKTYHSLQPRFNIRYLLNKGWALKGSFSTMQQYIHLLTNETIGLPTDLWLPSTARIKPQFAWQPAIGIAKTIKKDYEFSTEVYYKKMNNVISFKEGASLFQFDDWQNRVTQGEGEAYGLELFLQKKKGNFTGWIGYTLSWSNRLFNDINLGEKYPYKYDRRHDFEIVGSYKFSERVQLSGTWVFATGSAATFATSKYLGNNNYPSVYEHLGDRNNFRLPSYHRFDIGVDFIKQKKHFQRTWSFGAYNAYNRKNPFFLFLSEESKNVNGQFVTESKLRQASLFPIIPYVSYGFKF